jgi:hypothetical protein
MKVIGSNGHRYKDSMPRIGSMREIPVWDDIHPTAAALALSIKSPLTVLTHFDPSAESFDQSGEAATPSPRFMRGRAHAS